MADKKSFLELLLEETNEVKAVVPELTIKVPTQKDKKLEWLESMDLLDEKNRKMFVNSIYGNSIDISPDIEINEDNENNEINEPIAGINYKTIGTMPSVNLITICGRFSNLLFKEEEMIKYLKPTAEIPMICCNFGEVKFENFEYSTEKPKKSNRGRKKKPKPEKKRKVQGNGKYFQSQISFIIPYILPRELLETKKFKDLIPAGTTINDQPIAAPKPFKLKVFRTGVITLADVKQQTLEIAIEKLKLVAEIFNTAIKRAENEGGIKINYIDQSIDNDVKLISLIPIMKNCEFSIFIKEKEYLDLKTMAEIINKEIRPQLQKNISFSILEANHPKNSTKIFIKFKTPNAAKPAKKMRVNLFQANKKLNKKNNSNEEQKHCIKINTLGGLEDKNINNVFFTICNIFIKYRSKILLEFE
jgi:flagellar basal body rod protein FlgF